MKEEILLLLSVARNELTNDIALSGYIIIILGGGVDGWNIVNLYIVESRFQRLIRMYTENFF